MADHELLGGPPRPCHESVTSIARCGILRPSLNEFEDGISPTCGTIKRGGAFWFLSLRHGQWPNPKGSATFRSARESRSTPQAVNHVRSERLVVSSRGGQGFGSTRGC
ncbi:hypothetical protein ERO13_A09G171400v2 [Gossypium hirsutum]|uniref:Uncharacterized protein n=1 Tax=Gossypium hirsutum TaxID=3635 RepID=A0A1U8M7B8_GOSHI|nr:uncharacterized protein LOC107933670 [Gossypium hirsutum]KAG4184420.1 hypothetical protein ERO13_A09G171400v2 [Gossypium hirsutum]KAG4184421.1 hypothetical protein ERO13_A09G171400v2 [Gossypium hirsutum]KAG4184422.1 hypothetical protein ERO13_A09G171400v2 [Gossypium hirsutum]